MFCCACCLSPTALCAYVFSRCACTLRALRVWVYSCAGKFTHYFGHKTHGGVENYTAERKKTLKSSGFPLRACRCVILKVRNSPFSRDFRKELSSRFLRRYFPVLRRFFRFSRRFFRFSRTFIRFLRRIIYFSLTNKSLHVYGKVFALMWERRRTLVTQSCHWSENSVPRV